MDPILEKYFDAANGRDFAGQAGCFAEDATVRDEAEDQVGRAAIRKWIEETTRKYDHRFTVLGAKERDGATVGDGARGGEFSGESDRAGFRVRAAGWADCSFAGGMSGLFDTSGIAARIREIRRLRGLSPEAVAVGCGLNLSSYYDLEAHDGEFQSVISLEGIARLSEVLNDEGLARFGAEGAEVVCLADLPMWVERYRVAQGCTMEQIGDKAGYDLGKGVPGLAEMLATWNFDCLQSVCELAGVRVVRIHR